MSNKSVPFKETLYLAIGEAAVSAIVVAVFLIIKKFTLSVLLGAILGSAVIIVNFLVLSVSVNRAIDKALENAPGSIAKRLSDAEAVDAAVDEVLASEAAVDEALESSETEEASTESEVCDTPEETDGTDGDGEGEDEPDEAELFAQKYALSVQNSVKLSYIIRTLSMLAVLVVAFIIPDVFNVIAAVIPMLMFRPILMLESYLRNRKAK